MLVTELPVGVQVRLVVVLGLVVLLQLLVLEEKGWLPMPYQLRENSFLQVQYPSVAGVSCSGSSKFGYPLTTDDFVL